MFQVKTQLEFETENEVVYKLVDSLVSSDKFSKFIKAYLESLSKGYATLNLEGISKAVLENIEDDVESDTEDFSEIFSGFETILESKLESKLESTLESMLEKLATRGVQLTQGVQIAQGVQGEINPKQIEVAEEVDDMWEDDEEDMDDMDFDDMDDDDDSPKFEISLDAIKNINKKLSGGD